MVRERPPRHEYCRDTVPRALARPRQDHSHRPRSSGALPPTTGPVARRRAALSPIPAPRPLEGGVDLRTRARCCAREASAPCTTKVLRRRDSCRIAGRPAPPTSTAWPERRTPPARVDYALHSAGQCRQGRGTGSLSSASPAPQSACDALRQYSVTPGRQTGCASAVSARAIVSAFSSGRSRRGMLRLAGLGSAISAHAAGDCVGAVGESPAPSALLSCRRLAELPRRPLMLRRYGAVICEPKLRDEAAATACDDGPAMVAVRSLRSQSRATPLLASGLGDRSSGRLRSRQDRHDRVHLGLPQSTRGLLLTCRAPVRISLPVPGAR